MYFQLFLHLIDMIWQLQDKSGPKPRPAVRHFQPWTSPALKLKTSPALRCQDKSSPKTIQDKSSPETCQDKSGPKTSQDKSSPETSPALRHVQPRDISGREKNWPLLNDLYLLYIIYKRLFVGLSWSMMEQIVVHSFLLASLALLASLYCTLFYWLLCIGLSFSGLFCLASSLRFNSKSLF